MKQLDQSRPLMLRSQITMYCYLGNVLTRLHCTKFANVFFIFRCVFPLTICCNCCFTSNFEQHLSVLGPCLMALALHLMMLGTVYSGLCYSNGPFLAGAVVVVTSFLRLNLFLFYVSYGMYYFPVHFSI